MKTQKTISVKAFAKMVNLTERRIYQLADEEHLTKPIDGQLIFPECVTELLKFYQRDGQELKREKLALITATRKAKELDLDREQGKSIARDVATRTFIGILRNYHGLVREMIEKASPAQRRDKLTELGAGETTTAAFFAFDIAASQAVIDEIENRWAASGREAQKI